MTPHLFRPLTLRSLTVRNRAWLAPMCQYSSVDGMPTDWHLVHLGARASGGFGLVLTEAAAVSPEGRISPEDAGIWNDEQAAAWARVAAFVRGQGAAVGVQLAHAGRKASTYRPWAEQQGTVPVTDDGWTTLGPSEVAFAGYDAPAALDQGGIDQVISDFATAADRAVGAGFDTVEIHAAHGYLLHQFHSPLSTQREDDYGGTFEGRVKLLREVTRAVRTAIPDAMPLLVRISGTDWTDGGWDLDQSVDLARRLREDGVDLVDVSSGGNVAGAIPVGPGYQVPLATGVREAGIPTGAVGLITEPAQAEQVLATGQADAVLLARAGLREPSWPLRAAHELGLAPADAPWPSQYVRGAWR